MLQLHSKSIKPLGQSSKERMIIRLTENDNMPAPLRSKHILLLKSQPAELPAGFKAYFAFENEFKENLSSNLKDVNNVYLLPDYLNYLSDEDIVRFDSTNGFLNTLYRRNASQNSMLVTERCNNFCLMCSQPPRDINDSFIVEDLLQAIPLMSRETKELGITGGEPTLLGDDLLRIIRACKSYLPETSLHILSNGRNFSDLSFTSKVAEIEHPDLMIGIPLYSDISNIHDYVVQADGAYDQTIKGIMNLKRYQQQVELRVVLHKQTYKRLPQLAEFITRNLLFVDHVALMGLEMMGFTKANLSDLWIDPKDYQSELIKAVEMLDQFRMNISIYNHQLCILDEKLWKFNKKSISDWKNEYMPECNTCTKTVQCGGFFSSAKLKYSDHIKPFLNEQHLMKIIQKV